MKPFVFISDFDGTLTETDFYHIIIDKYLGDWGRSLYAGWKKGEMKDIEFLGTVFQSMNRSEEEIFEDILLIRLDQHAASFIDCVKGSGGEFVVLSAGTKYYIDVLFNHYGLEHVPVISNPGIYADRGIKMMPDNRSPFYSERYGVDKAAVVRHYKTKYNKVYFAGDSEPDVHAAKEADVVFAKGVLRQYLKEKDIAFIPFGDYSQIEHNLLQSGVLHR